MVTWYRKSLYYYSHITQNRRSPDGRWAKNWKSTDVGTNFGRYFGRPTTFLSKHSSKKFRWPIHRFSGVLSSVKRRAMVAPWSADNRPTLWRFLHHNVGRRSPDHRVSIDRRSADGWSMIFYQRTVGRQKRDIGRHSADCQSIINFGLCYNVYNACIHINYEIYHAFIYFGTHFIWPRVLVIFDFCVGIPIFVWHFEINIRLQPYYGHSLTYDDWNLILNIL